MCEAWTDDASPGIGPMGNPLKAGHLDTPGGGESEATLLEARIKTLEENGKEAMSPHDWQNGYSPAGLIRLLRGQIDFLRDNSPETLHAKANLATGQEEVSHQVKAIAA